MGSLIDLLRSAAPTLATAVAGPLGGAAVQAIAQKFGVENTVTAVATAIAGDPKAAEKLAELEFEYAKLDADDRASARSMQVAALGQADWFAKNFVNLLACIVVIGSGILLAVSKEQDVRMAAASFVTFILGFYYGTSQSSQRKTELLAKK